MDLGRGGNGNGGGGDSYPRAVAGPSVGYTDLLDFEIEAKQKADDEARREGRGKRSNPLRPSSAGACGRRLAYELNQYRGKANYASDVRSPATYRLLELGHSVEFAALRTFQLLKVCEQKYKQQVLTFFEVERGSPELAREVVEGSCDVVFWSKNYRAIADVKSKKDGWSASYKSRWEEEIDTLRSLPSVIPLSDTAIWVPDLEAFLEELGPDDFLCDNLYQLNLYACSDFMREREIDHAFLYRYNKNDSRHFEIRFRPSMRTYERVKEKFNRVAVAVDRGLLEDVRRDFVLGSQRCGLCPFKKECWPQDDALKSWFRNMPPKNWPKDILVNDELLPRFEKFSSFDSLEDEREAIEREIVKELVERRINKVRLPNGQVFEVKFLKSPKPHYELRKSKT